MQGQRKRDWPKGEGHNALGEGYQTCGARWRKCERSKCVWVVEELPLTEEGDVKCVCMGESEEGC